MKVCLQKSTGRVIEMQDSATDGTLITNCVNGGLDASDLEERDVTPEEYAQLIAPQQAKTLVLAQIAALEAKQDRSVREAILTGDTTRVKAINDEIIALRAQLGA